MYISLIIMGIIIYGNYIMGIIIYNNYYIYNIYIINIC